MSLRRNSHGGGRGGGGGGGDGGGMRAMPFATVFFLPTLPPRTAQIGHYLQHMVIGTLTTLAIN